MSRVTRMAVIAAARKFLAAHDRIVASATVTRDDTFAMKNAADDLRDVLREHDESPVFAEAATDRRTPCPDCPHWMELHNPDGSCGCGASHPGAATREGGESR